MVPIVHLFELAGSLLLIQSFVYHRNTFFLNKSRQIDSKEIENVITMAPR